MSRSTAEQAITSLSLSLFLSAQSPPRHSSVLFFFFFIPSVFLRLPLSISLHPVPQQARESNSFSLLWSSVSI